MGPGRWPADQKDAYRMVAHHVLMALYDVDQPLGQPGVDRRQGRHRLTRLTGIELLE